MKSLLMCVLLVVVAVVAFNYWNGVPLLSDPRTARPAAVGTTGTVDVNAARERGAEVGEKVAVAAAKVRDQRAGSGAHLEDQGEDGARRHDQGAVDRRDAPKAPP